VTVADEVEVTDQEQVTEDVGLWQRPVNKWDPNTRTYAWAGRDRWWCAVSSQ
jgi:hypothetical protein